MHAMYIYSNRNILLEFSVSYYCTFKIKNFNKLLKKETMILKFKQFFYFILFYLLE